MFESRQHYKNVFEEVAVKVMNSPLEVPCTGPILLLGVKETYDSSTPCNTVNILSTPEAWLCGWQCQSISPSSWFGWTISLNWMTFVTYFNHLRETESYWWFWSAHCFFSWYVLLSLKDCSGSIGWTVVISASDIHVSFRMCYLVPPSNQNSSLPHKVIIEEQINNGFIKTHIVKWL